MAVQLAKGLHAESSWTKTFMAGQPSWLGGFVHLLSPSRPALLPMIHAASSCRIIIDSPF